MVVPVMLGNISKRLRKRFLFEPSNLFLSGNFISRVAPLQKQLISG